MATILATVVCTANVVAVCVASCVSARFPSPSTTTAYGESLPLVVSLEAADVTAAAAREVGAAMSAAATAVEINAIVLVAAAPAASVEVATAFASPFQVL